MATRSYHNDPSSVDHAVDALRKHLSSEGPVKDLDAVKWAEDPAFRLRVMVRFLEVEYVPPLTSQDALGFQLTMLAVDPQWLPEGRPTCAEDFDASIAGYVSAFSAAVPDLMERECFYPPEKAVERFRLWLDERLIPAAREQVHSAWAKVLQRLWYCRHKIQNAAGIAGLDRAVLKAFSLARTLPSDTKAAKKEIARM